MLPILTSVNILSYGRFVHRQHLVAILNKLLLLLLLLLFAHCDVITPTEQKGADRICTNYGSNRCPIC